MEEDSSIRLINILRSRQRTFEELQVILDFLMSVEALENILDSLSTAERNHLCRACHLAAYEEGELIFTKGEKSDKFFVIISGVVECVNIAKDETVLYGTTLSTNQTLGEKGIMTDHPRSMTVRGQSAVYLACITAKDFKTYLERGILARFEVRLNFVEGSIPIISAYTAAQKMNIVYALIKLTFKRNHLVLPPQAVSDFLYFVFEGECALTVNRKGHERKFVKLGRGACVGDESVLLGRRSEYGVRVTSEFADFFALKRSDIPVVLIEETMNQLKKNCDMKQISRVLLTRLEAQRQSIPQHQGLSSAKRFPLANLQARKSLMKAVNRSYINLTECNSRASISPVRSFTRCSSIKQKLLDLTTYIPQKKRRRIQFRHIQLAQLERKLHNQSILDAKMK